MADKSLPLFSFTNNGAILLYEQKYSLLFHRITRGVIHDNYRNIFSDHNVKYFYKSQRWVIRAVDNGRKKHIPSDFLTIIDLQQL